MQKAIARQKDLIKEKEKKIEEKNQELAELQESNKAELEALNQQYENELSRKQDLDKRLSEVRTELTNIEQTFPQELMQLKNRIAEAKKETVEYEQKT